MIVIVFEEAALLARAMVTRWGFSDELGTVMYGENQEEVFLGYSMGQQQTLSEATAQKIDTEVRRLVEAGLAEATRIITEKRQDLETLAKGLLEYETLTGEEIRELLKGHAPMRDTSDDYEPPLRGSPVPTTGVVRPKPGPSRADWSRSRRRKWPARYLGSVICGHPIIAVGA